MVGTGLPFFDFFFCYLYGLKTDSMKKYLFVFCFSLALVSCYSPSPRGSEEAGGITTDVKDDSLAHVFWNRLKALQGKAFEGKLVSAPANDDFAGKRLVMHVLYGDEETILIPFNVGDNMSRTWIFKNKSGRIELKHDHRMESGMSDEITMYGGTSTNGGKPDVQIFPADQETVDMLPGAFSNVWWVTIDSTTYTYNLRRIGTDRVFSVAFDLTREVERPLPSWGWENFKMGK